MLSTSFVRTASLYDIVFVKLAELGNEVVAEADGSAVDTCVLVPASSGQSVTELAVLGPAWLILGHSLIPRNDSTNSSFEDRTETVFFRTVISDLSAYISS